MTFLQITTILKQQEHIKQQGDSFPSVTKRRDQSPQFELSCNSTRDEGDQVERSQLEHDRDRDGRDGDEYATCYERNLSYLARVR